MSVNSGIERYIKSVDINFDNMKESKSESKSPIQNSDENTKIDNPSITQNPEVQNITEKFKELNLELKESDSNQLTTTATTATTATTTTTTNIKPTLDSTDNKDAKKDITNLNIDLTTTNNNNIINNTNNYTTAKDSTVNTDECLPPALMKSPNHNMKYRINEDFNKHSPMVKLQQLEDQKSTKSNSNEPAWMPEILRGQEWETDSYNNTNNNDTNNLKNTNNNENNKSSQRNYKS
ncbi:unnamed protein product [[Candida] boidinii]|uniref:Unnamed protein product n=1 Tax=Candida boidinii TaxID=5477 RepID=A0ACB5TWQ4_CANBO|nr:unnamed protein product [[Candida] boidinii]